MHWNDPCILMVVHVQKYTAYKHMHYYTAYKHMHHDIFSPFIMLYFNLHPLAYGSVSLHCKLWLVDIAK